MTYGGTFKTRTEAQDALISFYAEGQLSIAEVDRIEKRNGRWVIVLKYF